MKQKNRIIRKKGIVNTISLKELFKFIKENYYNKLYGVKNGKGYKQNKKTKSKGNY